jgi:hypothetical protein
MCNEDRILFLEEFPDATLEFLFLVGGEIGPHRVPGNMDAFANGVRGNLNTAG